MSASKEQFVIPDSPLWKYIGDLSQDVLDCSYNEEDIREMWVKGTLDNWVEHALIAYPWRLKRYHREDRKYSDMLTAYVVLHRGWAKEWGPEIDILTLEESTKVSVFLAQYDIVVSK